MQLGVGRVVLVESDHLFISPPLEHHTLRDVFPGCLLAFAHRAAVRECVGTDASKR